MKRHCENEVQHPHSTVRSAFALNTDAALHVPARPVSGLLVFVGTFFLVYTFDVTELILNAVALGIILDIDDLLFDALATTPGRHLVHQLDPLPMPSMPRLRGADAKSVCMSIFIPALTIFVYFTMLGSPNWS